MSSRRVSYQLDVFVIHNYIEVYSKGRWRSWLSHLSNKCTQKVLSSSLGRLILVPYSCVSYHSIMYLYELPTTGAISFSDFCLDQSAGRVTSIGILQATEARANLRQALKKCKRAEDGTRDYLSLTKVSNLD